MMVSSAALELDLVVGVVELLGRVVLRLAALDRQLVELLVGVGVVRVAVLRAIGVDHVERIDADHVGRDAVVRVGVVDDRVHARRRTSRTAAAAGAPDVQLAAPSVTRRIARGTSAGKVLRWLIAAVMPAVAGVPPAIVMLSAAGMPLRIASLVLRLDRDLDVAVHEAGLVRVDHLRRLVGEQVGAEVDLVVELGDDRVDRLVQAVPAGDRRRVGVGVVVPLGQHRARLVEHEHHVRDHRLERRAHHHAGYVLGGRAVARGRRIAGRRAVGRGRAGARRSSCRRCRPRSSSCRRTRRS